VRIWDVSKFKDDNKIPSIEEMPKQDSKVGQRTTQVIGKKDKQALLRECLEGSMKLTKIIKEQLAILQEKGINDIIIPEKD